MEYRFYMESTIKPKRVRKPLSLREEYERTRTKLVNKAWVLNNKAYKLWVAGRYQDSKTISIEEARLRQQIGILNFRISCTWGKAPQRSDAEVLAIITAQPELGGGQRL